MAGTIPAESHARHAIVVGAGFAGLAAAQQLMAAKCRVTVVEAGSRVGGRAHTAQLPGVGKAELGATWLHGLDGNPIYETALRHGLMHGHERKVANKLWGSAQYLRPGQDNALTQAELQTVRWTLKQFTMALNNAQRASTPRSLGSYLREAWQGDICHDTWALQRPTASYASSKQGVLQISGEAKGSDELALMAATWKSRESLQRGMDGCHTTDDLSAPGLAAYSDSELPGPNLPLPCGYSAVAEQLAEGLDITFGWRLAQLEWGSTNSTSSASTSGSTSSTPPESSGSRKIVLRSASGQVIEADAVILTLPLGVLKAEHAAMFQPALPPAKTRVISDLGFGCVDKLFISFPEATTPLPSPASSTSAPERDHKELIRSYQLLWPQQDPSALGPISSQLASESVQNSRAAGCTCNTGHTSNGSTDASATEAKIAPSVAASCTTGTGRGSGGDKAGSGRQPLRELSHQTSHQQAAAGQTAAQQGKHSSTGRVHSKESAGQCTACEAESQQDAEVEEAWYTNLHSMRFGGSEFVNSARWFMAGQAGPSSSSAARDDSNSTPAQAQSSVHSAPGNASSAGAEQAVPLEARRVGAESAPQAPYVSSLPQPADAEADNSSSGDSSDEDDAEVWDDAAGLPVKPWRSELGPCACWVVGAAAEAMEQLPEAALHEDVGRMLEGLPGLQLPEDFQVHRTQWGLDPLARGSYSYPAAATQLGDQDRLAEPLLDQEDGRPLVLFAGEATHAEHYGTAHGAFMSGVREAERLLAAWQSQSLQDKQLV